MKNLVWLLLLVGCQYSPPQIKDVIVQPPPQRSPVLSWETNHPERKVWSDILVASIEKDFDKLVVAKDMSKWCAKFTGLQKADKVFVIAELFVKLAEKESSFNPKASFKEPAPLNVYSLGLYQLSYEDKMSHCVMDKAKQTLFDPLENIKCAVGQAAKLVAKEGVLTAYPPAKGMAKYWSVMREVQSDGERRPSYAVVKNHVGALSVCK